MVTQQNTTRVELQLTTMSEQQQPVEVEDDENSNNLIKNSNKSSCYNNNNGGNSFHQIGLVERESLMMMDLDLDLDGSWIFDHISTDPTSPFLLSDHPFSPLWPFSDDNNNNHDDGCGSLSGPVTGVSVPALPSCKSCLYSLVYWLLFCFD